MKIIELPTSSNNSVRKSIQGNSTLSPIDDDQRKVSTINIVVNDSSQINVEKLSLRLPTVAVSKVIKNLEKLVAQEEFRQCSKDKFNLLTKREVQILELLASGLNNPAISRKLYISRRTVEQHHKNLNRKLGIKSYADVIKYSQAFDLI